MSLLLSSCHPSLTQNKNDVNTPAAVSSLEGSDQSDQALVELAKGNERFRNENFEKKDLGQAKRSSLAREGQHPHAVIVSCSDSRVPPEILFDQALGDLFVIRVAGNVVGPVEMGSIEYAVKHLNVPLIIVMGHEKCGALTAAVEGETISGNLRTIAEELVPAVTEARISGLTGDRLVEKAIEINIRNMKKEILTNPIVQEAASVNAVEVQSAKYHLETGIVEWYEN